MVKFKSRCSNTEKDEVLKWFSTITVCFHKLTSKQHIKRERSFNTLYKLRSIKDKTLVETSI